ncbi:ThiF Dinucleotide-utilizing enzymes involved in molybdopterin and thiamine biosynthesis family 2 [Burkholderiaceae bacterium]
MDDGQLLRYSRHILLDEIGIEGQQALLQAHVLIVGAGGLGSPAALYLGSAGVGQLTVVDPDTVELSNLQRQIAHTQDRVGQAKVDSLAQAVAAINPEVHVHAHQSRADAAWLHRAVSEADVVLDCTDNYATRQAINRACVRHRKPLVSGAAIRMDAQVSVYDARQSGSACYACVFPPEEVATEVSCATMGVFAPLVGIVGSLQAAEAIKLITGMGSSLVGRLWMLDGRDMSTSHIQLSANPHCPVCGQSHAG